MEKKLIIEKLKSENELKTKWLSLIAHDFKGMFHNIVYLLNAYEKKDIPQEMFLTMLPEIKQIAEKNLKTLDSTFAWINAQTDGFKLQIEDVSIYELFLELKEELHSQISSKDISIRYSGDETLVLQSDKLLLKFILKQVLENAVKYSNKDAEVMFIAGSQHNETCIEIKDQGMGMSNNVHNNIFTLDGSPYKGTQNEVGAGLSLVIVKDFIEKLGGSVEVHSKPNEGTIVKISLDTKHRA
ncbi:MAG TPA: HAMP domain-containing sensor histidine kinase [Dysgonamonadaceae bacterium]|nr:HAMP domain-containing sensor histidine kinase [Dysgonamonadaceae bacterium]